MENKGKEKQYLVENPDAYEEERVGDEKVVARLKKLCEITDGEDLNCLDIGSGMGLFLITLNRLGVQGCGVELQDVLVEKAIENCEYMGFTPDVRQGAAEDIPYPDSFFALVIAKDVLEHVMDWERSAEEFARVLKPGGVIYIETTNRQHPRQWEVNDFPFFSWLPPSWQRRYVEYCLRERPDKINYTPYPVRIFFTHRQLRRKYEQLGMTVHDRFDLFNEAWFSGKKRLLRPLALLFRYAPVKWLLYIVTPMTKIYAVRPAAGQYDLKGQRRPCDPSIIEPI